MYRQSLLRQEVAAKSLRHGKLPALRLSPVVSSFQGQPQNIIVTSPQEALYIYLSLVAQDYCRIASLDQPSHGGYAVKTAGVFAHQFVVYKSLLQSQTVKRLFSRRISSAD